MPSHDGAALAFHANVFCDVTSIQNFYRPLASLVSAAWASQPFGVAAGQSAIFSSVIASQCIMENYLRQKMSCCRQWLAQRAEPQAGTAVNFGHAVAGQGQRQGHAGSPP